MIKVRIFFVFILDIGLMIRNKENCVIQFYFILFWKKEAINENILYWFDSIRYKQTFLVVQILSANAAGEKALVRKRKYLE